VGHVIAHDLIPLAMNEICSGWHRVNEDCEALVTRFGFADALGVVAGLSAIAYMPGLVDPLTLPKLLILVSGSLALAPVILLRWKRLGPWGAVARVTSGVFVLLVLWGLISTIFSGAPWSLSVFGWWGRGVGLLAWIGACLLLLGAATLTPKEVSRTVSWILAGATIAALVATLQALGLSVPVEQQSGAVVGLMGNTNFASGYFAVVAVLAISQVLGPGPTWVRVWAGGLFVMSVAAILNTNSLQGLFAMAAGLIVMLAAVAWNLDGRFRWVGRSTVLATAATLLLLVAASFLALGPLAGIWAERTFEIRAQYWVTALEIMRAEPLFGTGPDGFARFVSQYRPQRLVELLGPAGRPSAVHNIALQFGAAIGWPGLVLWLAGFVGTTGVLGRRILLRETGPTFLAAGVLGALVAYLTQGLVSIDMIPLLVTGWIVAGSSIAMSAPPESPTSSPSAVDYDSPAQRAEAKADTRQGDLVQRMKASRTCTAVAVTLGLAGALLVTSEIQQVERLRNLDTDEAIVSFLVNPMTPCVLRANVAQEVTQRPLTFPWVSAINSATKLDFRCPPMVTLQSQLALTNGDASLAAQSTERGIILDPLLDYSWLHRAIYLAGQGQSREARVALQEARRLQSMYPKRVPKAPLERYQEMIKAVDSD